jgi:multicomponent Na+:H+ antiporter subunit C
MNPSILYGLAGAAMVGIGLYGLIAHRHLLRRILGFSLASSGAFLLFGSFAARHPTLAADPVPQAMIITGIIVALAGTALGLALAVRIREETGEISLIGDDDDGAHGGGPR